jgi:hypothetical protein
VVLKTGNEKFVCNDKPSNNSMLDFWRWSFSDMVSNAARGVLAEFVVATATNINTNVPRDEWATFDLTTPDGIKLEIKSAAYLQTWFQNKPSTISFDISPTKKWDYETNKHEPNHKGHADVYVFCLLHHKDKVTVNPLNMNQWEFYVVETKKINDEKPTQKSIGINGLKEMTDAVSYDELNEEVKYKHKRNFLS